MDVHELTTAEETTGPREHAVITEISQTGVGVIRAAFEPTAVENARRTVLAHGGLMKNTRPNPSSRHLAGFHRFPALEPLHLMITNNQVVQDHLTLLLGDDLRTIGLSDITINRSQSWHKDLLRGQYSHYMDGERTCASNHSKVFKVIMYLQDSSSLQVVPGSHRKDISLGSDQEAIPSHVDPVKRLDVSVGDAVIIDVCTTHRGSDEAAFESPEARDHPKILISTVFGRAHCEFTDRMEAGNAARLADWARRRP